MPVKPHPVAGLGPLVCSINLYRIIESTPMTQIEILMYEPPFGGALTSAPLVHPSINQLATGA